MSFISSLQNIGAFARVRFNGSATNQAPQVSAPAVEDRTNLLRTRSQLVKIYRALEQIADLIDVKTRFRLDLPDAVSSSSLGLDLSSTAATLQSTDEINASPNSFSPFGPEWSGSSTAPITIGGEYDGSNGTGTLSFESRRTGVKGINDLRIRIRDPQGAVLANLNIRDTDPPDQQYSLNNGLFLTLGAGQLINGDTTSLQVFQNIGSAVNPDNPLGGVRNSDPNFQYYAPPNTLAPVVDGSFDVNGENISVGTADTLNDIIDRINQSSAGVTATFNGVSERVEFVHDTPGSAGTIDIQNDTSNLIVAAKLDAAVLVSGTDPEDRVVLDNVAQFSSVQAGSLLVNGTPIAVDPSSDSLDSLLDSINASAADVTASFNAQTQLVTIAANDPESVFELDSNGTGFFAAINMVEGRVDPVAGAGGISKTRSYDIANAFEQLAEELNRLYDDQTFTAIEPAVIAPRAQLAIAATELFGNLGGRSDSRFGIRFDTSESGQTRGRFLDINRRSLTHSLQVRGDDVKRLVAGPDEQSGLIGRLVGAVGQALTDVNRTLGVSGGLLDTFA